MRTVGSSWGDTSRRSNVEYWKWNRAGGLARTKSTMAVREAGSESKDIVVSQAGPSRPLTLDAGRSQARPGRPSKGRRHLAPPEAPIFQAQKCRFARCALPAEGDPERRAWQRRSICSQSIDLLVRSSLSVLLVGYEAWLQRSVWDQIDLIDQSCVSWTPSDITGRERGDKETK